VAEIPLSSHTSCVALTSLAYARPVQQYALSAQRYEALKRKHKQKMKAWKQQLDVLEDQSELLTSGNGVRNPEHLHLLASCAVSDDTIGAERCPCAVLHLYPVI